MDTRLRPVSIRKMAGIILAVGGLSMVSAMLFAEEFNFVGTWKGEYSVAATPPSTAATPEPEAAPTPGRRTSGGGFGGGSFANTGPQKITLRVKMSKEKPTGNFTMGTSGAEDIREGRIVGNKLIFKTGLAPATIYDYDAALIGDDLAITRTAEGGKGGRPQVFTLKRSK